MPTSEHYRTVLRNAYLNRDDVAFEETLLKVLPVEKPRPTIEELEGILASNELLDVIVQHDGSICAVPVQNTTPPQPPPTPSS